MAMTGVDRWGGGLAILAAGAVMLLAIDPARGAVRACQPVINATGEDAASQVEARRKAMAGWLSQARKYGVAYTRWQLADKRRTFCAKSAAGGHACAVSGAPCMVSQVPGAPSIKPGNRKPLEI